MSIVEAEIRGTWAGHDVRTSTLSELFPEDRQALGPYGVLRVGDAIHYFRRRYVEPFLRVVSEERRIAVFLDAGSGFGWFSLALVEVRPGAVVLAVDLQRSRLRILDKLSHLLGVRKRVWPVVADLEALPFRTGAFVATACVEALEHVGEGEPRPIARRRQRRALSELARVTRGWMLVATPNRWFPWVSHDVSLPLAHWLPFGLRRMYAGLFRRAHRLERVHLLSPAWVERALGRPKVATAFLNFRNPDDWLSIFPLRVPYMPRPGSVLDRRGSLLARYGKLVHRLFGAGSRYFLHSLCVVYELNGRTLSK